MIDFLRTPDERFSNLPGYAFAPHYLEGADGGGGMRMHYVDEGPPDAAQVFLCLHGDPTWSYLYRKMIPPFVAACGRVVAPDFFGFGRSDKPTDPNQYSFDFHRASLHALIERLDLRNITLVCQDWGGLLGLSLPMDMPNRFSRLIVMNTGLGTGDAPLPQGWLDWCDWSAAHPDMAIGRLMKRACPHLTPGEAAAYDAPYPDIRYKVGVQRFPEIVPRRPDDPGAALSRRARDWWRSQWEGQSFMAIGMRDPVLGPAVMRVLHGVIRGCPEPLELAGAGHFVQEWGEEVAAAALAAFA